MLNQPESAYAKAHGQAEILLRNTDPRRLAREYAAQAQHTLRFLASNLVARAQRVAWEQFPQHNPGRVVRALSERCRQVVGDDQSVNRPTRGIRV